MSLAFDTIHYAVEALMFDRKLALDVIKEEDNGLSSEQKAALCKKIQELQDRPKTVKEKNRLENRLVGVLQPATLEFLGKTALIAEVFDWLPVAREKPGLIRFFAIQTTIPEIKIALSKQKVKNREHLIADEIRDEHIEEIFGHLRPSDKPRTYREDEPFIYGAETVHQFFLLCPKFHTLVIRRYESEDYVKTLGEGLKLCGEKTKFDSIEIQAGTKRVGIIRYFPPVKRLKYLHDITAEDLQFLLGFKHIKHLEITATPYLLDELACLEKMQQTELKLRINTLHAGSRVYPFEERHMAVFKKLPLVSLDLSWSLLDNQILELIPQLTTLQELNLSHSKITNSNIDLIDELVEACPSLKTIILSPHDENVASSYDYNLSIESIMRLQTRLSDIDFQDEQGLSYRNTHPHLFRPQQVRSGI